MREKIWISEFDAEDALVKKAGTRMSAGRTCVRSNRSNWRCLVPRHRSSVGAFAMKFSENEIYRGAYLFTEL